VAQDINNVRAGSETASGNNNAQAGDSVIYDNVATLEDGSQIYAVVTLVRTSDQDAWFSGECEAQSSITFTLETRRTQSGFTLSGDLIDDTVVTPVKPGQDTILGGTGQDKIYGEDGDDTLDGGAGDDHITGGEGNDTQVGGQGFDTFHDLDWGYTVDGNEDPDDSDVDVLDLTGSAPAGGYVHVNYDTGSPENGTVEFIGGNGAVVGTLQFENIETVIPCFTPGTLIATPQGERRVKDLREGDRVITRDNGIQ